MDSKLRYWQLYSIKWHIHILNFYICISHLIHTEFSFLIAGELIEMKMKLCLRIGKYKFITKGYNQNNEGPLCNNTQKTIEIHTLWWQDNIWLGMVLKDKIIISNLEKILATASIWNYKNRQKGKVTNIAEIRYKLSMQLQYEQYYAEIKGRLPIFEQKWSKTYSHFRVILKILSDVDKT